MRIDDLRVTPEDIKQGLVIPVDKPRGWSSFQVVNKLKWQIRRELGLKRLKIGHAGTLDPLATGLLLVCVGAATKLIPQLQEGEKCYTGTMALGATTPCFDLERVIDSFYPTAQIDTTSIEAARQRFVGRILQTPPTFSAVKVNGRRAYEAARQGEAQDIKAKEVTIERFAIVAYRPGIPLWNLPLLNDEDFLSALDSPSIWDQAHNCAQQGLYHNPQGKVPAFLPQLDFEVRCSKGTYLRSLARDFGAALGSGAFLCALRRTRIGDYSVDEAFSLLPQDNDLPVNAASAPNTLC